MGRTVMLECGACGRSNRVPAARVAEGPRCGACHTPLRADGHPIAVDGAALDALVAESPLPVLVDFWAAWCGPCRAMAPELERVARALAREVVVAKLDTDADSSAATRHGAQSIPLLVLFAGGAERWRAAGLRPAARLEAEVRAALGGAA